ncbi:MAG: tetratricopeptide repeat protein [Treponema sp.]
MSSLREGIKLYKAKDYEAALTFFLQYKPNGEGATSELPYYIGLTYAKLSSYESALAYLEQVVTQETDVARVYQCRLILALIYAKTNRTRLAEFELSKLLDAGYESVQVFSSMGYVSYEHKDVKNALEYYRKALSIDKNNSNALNGLGYVLADSEKDLAKAIVYCKRALEKEPTNPAYLDSLAWAYFKSGSVKEANAFIKKARKELANNATINKHAEIIQTSKNEASK